MASVSDLIEQVEKAVLKRRLFGSAKGILVAVSGGLDSMVLLEVLRRLADSHGWRLAVAHFNHRLRGRSSDADERLVAKTASKLGLRFVRGGADVREHAIKQKVSVEMAARELRHAFLARTARRLKMPTVALAHHADDQVELFFLRLLRGAGGEGLAGMKWRSTSPSGQHVTLVRPLLDRSKEELRVFAEEQGIAFREDATNAQLDFQRNRIRHELLPLLKKNYQPALTRVILRQMEILGAEAEVVAREARQAMKELELPITSRQPPSSRKIPNLKSQTRRSEGLEALDARAVGGSFDALPVAVQRRCLQMQAVEQGIAADFELIETLREEAERMVVVDKSLVVWRDIQGRLLARREPKQGRPKAAIQTGFGGRCKTLHLGSKSSGKSGLVFDGVQFKWRIRPGGDGTVRAQNKPESCEYFDADKVGLAVVLRHWQPGDRFQPIGMPTAVKLQDLFTNEKVLRNVRHELIVGVTASGEIFWVEGLRMGERFKLDKTTRRRLQWAWKRLK